MKQLYFVRHGMSVMNEEGRWSGQTETPLTDEGRREAKQAGHAAKDLGIGHILASPFSRTVDTATIIAAEIGYPFESIELDNLLIERGLGVLEGQPLSDNLRLDNFAYVEDLDALLDRVRQAYSHIKNLPADVVLIVSHGATGRALRHVINPAIPFEETDHFPNGKIVRLV